MSEDTTQEETVEEIADDLVKSVTAARRRIAKDGQILGWSGFHMDLDAAEERIRELRLAVRGLR